VRANRDVILLRTWPEENSRDLYGKGILLEVCGDRELVEMYNELGAHELENVKKLLKYNSKFAKTMSDVVRDCVFISDTHNFILE